MRAATSILRKHISGNLTSKEFFYFGTPKDRAQILQEAMVKTLIDPEFEKEYEKRAGDPLPAQ